MWNPEPTSLRSGVDDGSDVDLTVLGLFPSFGPDKIGGIETSARVAWQAITDITIRGHSASTMGSVDEPQSSFLFCYGGKGDTNKHDRDENSICVGSKPMAAFRAVQRQWNANVVLIWHLHLLKLLPLFRIRGAKIVVFLHGIEVWKRQDVFTRLLLRRVNLFLSNSDYTWQHFLTFHPQLQSISQRTVHLGVGVPLAAHVPITPPDHRPAVLMIGRLHRGEDYKGHREMIRAWPLVKRQIPDAQLWIVGSGDLQGDLEKIVQAHGLTSCVHFCGRLPDDEKEKLLLRCRCLALPSRGEGFGLVYLEAMRLGRPCLVSTLDAGREVVNPPEAGLAANPENPQDLSEAVCRLLKLGPEWKQWSHQAQKRYENQFTAVQFQRRLVSALLED